MESTENTLDINRSLGVDESSNYETYDEPFISLAGGSVRFEPMAFMARTYLRTMSCRPKVHPHIIDSTRQLRSFIPGFIGGPNYPQRASLQLYNQPNVETAAVVEAPAAASWTQASHDMSLSSSSSTRNERWAVADENRKKQDWTTLMPIINRLYINEGMILEEVRSIMMLIYHFKAR